MIAPTPPTVDEPPPPALPDEDEQPAKATEAQMRKLFALFGQHGVRDRDKRLEWANRHLERTIVSAKASPPMRRPR